MNTSKFNLIKNINNIDLNNIDFVIFEFLIYYCLIMLVQLLVEYSSL